MIRDDVINEYFEWLCGVICDPEYSEYVSYRKLLSHLHDVEFAYSMPMDQNRAEDGIDLRWRFACERDYMDCYMDIDGPCSVLEMMVALAIRCEEGIMDDPTIGDRTGQWFWEMIVNLGLGAMDDRRYDRHHVDISIDRLLNRDYEYNGKGGLFTVRGSNRDLRDMEILHQLYAYLNSII